MEWCKVWGGVLKEVGEELATMKVSSSREETLKTQRSKAGDWVFFVNLEKWNISNLSCLITSPN